MNLIWHEGRAFTSYLEWEDYTAGFFNRCRCKDPLKIDKSERLLSCPDDFDAACKVVLDKWPTTSAVNLTNGQINHKAWIGHAAAFLAHKSCEDCTISAWHRLNAIQQATANDVADYVVKEWVRQCVNENCQKQKSQLELMFLQQQKKE